VDTVVIRIQIEKHKSYMNIPLIPTKNIKVDEETKCLAGVGKNPRRASKSSRPNSKALILLLATRKKQKQGLSWIRYLGS
jgi:hypothetical protein